MGCCSKLISLFIPPVTVTENDRVKSRDMLRSLVKLEEDGETATSCWDQLLIDFSYKEYAERYSAIAYIEDKSYKLIQLQTLLMGAIYVLSSNGERNAAVMSKIGYACFLLSITILVLSRRSFSKPGLPSTYDMAGILANSSIPKAGVALSLNVSMEGLVTLASHLATHLRWATWLLIAGLLFLLLSITIA